MTIIEQIKTEIERRITDNTFGAKLELIDLLAWLDTLESERPEPYNPVYNEAYLNEKIKRATESWKGVDVDAMLAECRGYDEEKSEKPMNQEELEEEIRRFLSNATKMDKGEWKGKYPISEMGFGVVARHFAQWGAEHSKK